MLTSFSARSVSIASLTWATISIEHVFILLLYLHLCACIRSRQIRLDDHRHEAASEGGSRYRCDSSSSAEPFRRVANLRNIHGDRIFRGTGRATPPSSLCRNENSCNPLCHQFAARLAGALDVRLGEIAPAAA